MITEYELIRKVLEVENIKIEADDLGILMPVLDGIHVFDDYPYTEPMDKNYSFDDFKRLRLLPILNTRRVVSIGAYRHHKSINK